MKEFIKRHNISIQLMVLVVMLSSLSFYNYVSQKHLFINQLEDHTTDLMQSLRSSILKFRSVEQTLSTQKLVQRISLELDIFEFRYLDKDGVVISSMFQDEVGKSYQRPGIEKVLTDVNFLGKFYLEERDMTQVLAVSYPVYHNDVLRGIIDLAVDAPELNTLDSSARQVARQRMELDVTNMLNAVAGSISNSIEVYETVNMTEFLQHLVESSEGVVELTIMTRDGRVASSSKEVIPAGNRQLPETGAALIKRDGSSLYRLLAPLEENVVADDSLLLYIDASDYAMNERKLLYTALATSFLAIFFSMAIVYAIYRINLNRARKENIRLEGMVKERTAKIEQMSKTDKLTGLANRMHLDDQLEIEFKRASRHKHELVLLVIDLDHFKQVNDTYGHLGGDAVLREIARHLSDGLRQTDFIGRYGGEEFVVILPETSLKNALPIAEKLRKLIEAEPVIFERDELNITASIGVADFRHQSHHKFEDVFVLSDIALYYSKENGRNCVTYIDGDKPKIYSA